MLKAGSWEHDLSRRGWWRGPATIDGLAGTGKSTVALLLADPDIPILEVGALYRRLADRPPTVGTDADGPDASRLSRLLAVTQDPLVRQAVTRQQVQWAARHPQSIIVGRVGGHIFRDAEVKIFLTVSPAAQAQRLGSGSELLRTARLRDEADASRRRDPVLPAPDALRIDTSGRSPQEVVSIIDDAIRKDIGQWHT